MESNEWLTSEEAGKIIGVKKVTLDSMRSRGHGPVYYKIGNAVRYKEEDVREWYEARRKPVRVVPGKIA